MSQQSFTGLGVSAPVAEALAHHSITTPFPIQTRVIPDALAGLDVLAKSPTGSGKTLAFAVPIVERLERSASSPGGARARTYPRARGPGRRRLRGDRGARALTVAAVYGGVGIPAQAKRAKTPTSSSRRPGRLEDLVSRRMVSLDGVRILVLDEADRMLDMGFRPQVDRIVRRLSARAADHVLLGHAGRRGGTDGERVHARRTPPRGLAGVSRGAGRDRAPVRAGDRRDAKSRSSSSSCSEERGLALVFVRTKRGADRLVRKLERHDVVAVAMHGDKTQGAREKALRRFEAGRVSTLVATDVAARGLDLEKITHVINFDPPSEGKDYVHRVGRTGRAGRTGTGITLVLPEQQADVSRVAARVGETDQFENQGMKVAAPRVVYSSRRGRNDRWGKPRARRKI